MGDLRKMQVNDLVEAVMNYCDSGAGSEDPWWEWNVAWEKADDALRREALLVVATKLYVSETTLNALLRSS